MTGIEPRTSGIVSNRSTNWATTTAHYFLSFVYFDEMLYNEGGTPPKGISTKKMRRHLCCHRRSLSNKKQLLMHQMDGWMTNHQNTSQLLSVKAIYFRLFSRVDSKHSIKTLPLTGFKPQSFAVRSNRSTTDLRCKFLVDLITCSSLPRTNFRQCQGSNYFQIYSVYSSNFLFFLNLQRMSQATSTSIALSKVNLQQ